MIKSSDTNSNSLNNNPSTLVKNFFDTNNYEIDSTTRSASDAKFPSNVDSRARSFSDAKLPSNDSPLGILKDSLNPSSFSLGLPENSKPKLYRVPTGRRPIIKHQNFSQEIPETPVLPQENRFKPSEIKDDEFERFKQNNYDNEPTYKPLRKKDNVPIERIRKDSKASDYMSDDSAKDINIRSPYVKDYKDYSDKSTRSSKTRDIIENDDNKPLQSLTREKFDYEDRGRARSSVNEVEERGRAKSRTSEIDERGRAKSRTSEIDERGRAKSRTHEAREAREVEDRKSRAREIDERGRAKSKTREIDERGRAKSKTREVEERGRAKSKTREVEERGRAKSKTREVEERGRAKSRAREVDERAKSRTREIDERGRAKSRTREPEERSRAVSRSREFNEMEKPENAAARKKEYELLMEKEKHLRREKAFDNAVPPMFGWLYLELKKNKWKKRYCQVKDGALYHSKDMKGTNETLLCSMASFDVYTCIQMRRKQPTKFGFAIKSQDKMSLFENPEDYVHFLCAESSDKANDWKTSSPVIAETPHTLKTGSSQWDNVRRHVRSPTKKTPQGSSDYIPEFIQTNSPVSSGPFKSGSLLSYDEKNPPIKPVEVEQVTFAKGSLLATSDALYEQAKEREKVRRAMGGVGIIKDPNGNGTFVQLDDSVVFNKGSLLSKNVNATNQSPTGQLIQTSPIRFNEGSLLAKSREPSPVENSPTRSGLLIQIDDGVRYNKGSLLAKSQEQSPVENSSTRPGLLVQIDDGVRYNKGSLLAMSQTQSPVEISPTRPGLLIQIDDGVRYNKGSLLAKSQTQSPVETSPGFLIQIDDGVRYNKGSLLAKILHAKVI
ncbi:7929_t:CDS:2 [Racocetra fulgida]|uniref:7929_t:CDS:1 n=1 Tax=Racocetra fulgida TaxID=60492 RepID=A0A9N8Z7X4_9GLOM|nr:7929_t:CDS:2 [Racocetra fulgida]